MFKTHDLCRLLGVSKSTFINWEKSGKLPNPKRSLRGNREYSLEDVKEIITALSHKERLALVVNVGAEINTHKRNIAELENLLAHALVK